MGLRAFNKAIDDAVPKPGDSASDLIGKALTSWIAGPMALLDLFSPEPDTDSSPSRDSRSGGGCHCDCDSHR
jgi:hypothetical protein